MANTVAPSLACNLNFIVTNKNSKSLFLMPSCPKKLFDVIMKLKIKKAKRT